MTKEEYDKYKKVVQNLDGYDICDEFNLCTYELKDKKKILEIVLIHYFKLQEENEKLNNTLDKIIEENIVVRDRLSKAIEYIEKRDFVEVEIINEPFNDDFNCKENLLSILKEGNNG